MRRRFAAILLATATAAAGCSPSKDEPDEDPVTEWSVPHYDYAIDFRTGAATATLTVDVPGEGHCLSIPFAPEEIDVSTVTIDGDDVGFGIDEETGILRACGRHLEAETVPLAVTFAVPADTIGPSDVGLGTFPDVDGNDTTYLLSWVEECDRTGPCDPTPARFSTYRLTVEHDPAQQVLCSGSVTTPGAGTTVCDFALDAGPIYSTFGAIAGQWTATPLGAWGASAVNVTLHDRPATGVAAALQTSSLQGFFGWMEMTFGDYAYGTELRLVTADTYWQGFEHPGNIVLSSRLPGSGSVYLDPLTHVTMHEIAHQWAGDQTTLAGKYDFVWKEAMAEYLAFVYEDESLPPGAAAATAAAWKTFSLGVVHPPVPEYSVELFNYYGDVYGPGPMILFRQLEVMFGRAAVIVALQDLLGTPRALSVIEVQAALEASTGASLDAYFDAWVFGDDDPAWPEATIALSDAGAGALNVGVSLATADGTPHGCAFTVQLVGTAGNALDVPFDFGVSGGGTPLTQIVTPGFTVTGTTLDPYAECLVFAPGQALTAPARPHPWQAR